MADNFNCEELDKVKGKSTTSNSSPRTPRNSSFPCGFNPGFMPYHSSQVGQGPNFWNNLQMQDANFWGIGQQPTMSFMNMLNAPPSLQRQSYSVGETPSPIQQCQSNKRGANDIDGDESSSPNPKRKKKAIAHKSKKKEACKRRVNILWESKHDDLLIPFLAKCARDGLKADKRFKKTVYNSAAFHINEQLGSTFTSENVKNRMRTIRNRFLDMQKCRINVENHINGLF
ncbi:uncharacterized protein LOC109842518 [Asparagus officinalis]|uniref:uncharacterized protein LOC109842518 n=1 Tax=Asparagus officinalis TaxID=4686 RepID=UPI00098DFE2B|nr:uncharacterized protein LOC109842518 [Asparagus officinalis]